MGQIVYTIGYERRELRELLDLIAASGIERVVDVRELPLSRKPGFSKRRLAEALQRVGIEYEHVRELGNPKEYRDLYRAGHVDAGAKAYRRHLHNGSYSALKTLARAIDRPTCLLCLEHEHNSCHRAVIVEALVALRPDVKITQL